IRGQIEKRDACGNNATDHIRCNLSNGLNDMICSRVYRPLPMYIHLLSRSNLSNLHDLLDSLHRHAEKRHVVLVRRGASRVACTVGAATGTSRALWPWIHAMEPINVRHKLPAPHMGEALPLEEGEQDLLRQRVDTRDV